MPDGSTGVFDAYAGYYDLLYKDKDYAAEAAHVAAHVRREIPGASSTLEIGCGSGGHAEAFAAMEFVVHGVDMSGQMIARAEDRKAALTPDLADRMSFRVGDARTVRTGATYDAVLLLFNVIGYQTSDEELRAVFETAAAHLRPGGVLMFDYWYGPAVLKDPPIVRVKRFESEEIKVTRIAEPVLHADTHVIDVNFALFIELKATGEVRPVQEVHKVRYLFPAELAKLHGGAFDDRGSYEWMTDGPPHAGSWNAFQLFRRI